MRNDAVASDQSDELARTVRRAVDVSLRRWKTFVASFLISASVIQAAAFFWPGTFAARAAILLQKTRSTGAVDYDPKQPTTVVTGVPSAEEVNSETALLTSGEVLNATVEETGIDRVPPPWYLRILFAPLRGYERAYAWFHELPAPTARSRTVSGVAASLSVDRLKESNVLVVSYEAGDPRVAEIVLDNLLKHYQDWHVKVHSRIDGNTFFTEQTSVLAEEVNRLQVRLRELKRTLGVADIAQEREVAMRREANLHEEQELLWRRQAELDGKIQSLIATKTADAGSTQTSTTTRPGSATLDTIRAQALQLELDQIRLESRFVDSAPLVVENRQKLEAARRAIDGQQRRMSEESTTGPNPTIVAVDQDVARSAAEQQGLKSRLGVLNAQLAAARDRVRALDAKADEADKLQLQIKSANDRYLMYLDRSERARVDAALDRNGVTDVSIVQQASASVKPVRPKRLITLIVSIVGGLAIGLFICAWLELAALGLEGAVAYAAPRTEPSA